SRPRIRAAIRTPGNSSCDRTPISTAYPKLTGPRTSLTCLLILNRLGRAMPWRLLARLRRHPVQREFVGWKLRRHDGEYPRRIEPPNFFQSGLVVLVQHQQERA